MEGLGLAANIIAVVDLFVQVGALCSVYCNDVRTAKGDVRYLLNQADRFAATLREVQRLLAGPHKTKIDASENVRNGVSDCELQLNKLIGKLTSGIGSRILWPFKKTEVAEIVKNLERCRATISLDLQVNQTYAITSSIIGVVLITSQGLAS